MAPLPNLILLGVEKPRVTVAVLRVLEPPVRAVDGELQLLAAVPRLLESLMAIHHEVNEHGGLLVIPQLIGRGLSCLWSRRQLHA